ncbi:MAG: diacylglycerol/lipid kinase family protein [Thermoanaerobaculia bacterium]
MRAAVLVFNPFAGRRRSATLLSRVTEALRGSGFDAEPLPTRAPGDATERAREATQDGVDIVFALGGDGTLRECAAGLLGTDSVLGFLPTGTINVMALELGVPLRPVAAARAFAGASAIPFGVGLAGEVPFLMQVSAGVDAFLVGAMRPNEKRFLGPASAVPAIFRSLARYSFPPFEISSPSGTRTATLAVASNIRRYGGPWKLTPKASSDGSSLDLFSFSGRGRAAAIRLALSLLVGRQLRVPGSHCERIGNAALRTVPALPFQIDGDVLPTAPDHELEIALSGHTLRMLVPPR